MFEKGQVIVHPAHGVGIIKDIETKYIQGMQKQYYIIEPPLNSIEKIMVPIKKAEQLGIRKLSTDKEIFEALEILSSENIEIDFDESVWNKRFPAIKNRLKTGAINDIAYVLKYLHERRKIKKLGMNEESLYLKAFKLLAGEIMFALRKSEQTAILFIENALSKANKFSYL